MKDYKSYTKILDTSKRDNIFNFSRKIEGLEKIKEIISYFRNNILESFNNKKIIDIKDYEKGIDNLPKANVLKYFLEDESWRALTIGTEPKLIWQ